MARSGHGVAIVRERRDGVVTTRIALASPARLRRGRQPSSPADTGRSRARAVCVDDEDERQLTASDERRCGHRQRAPRWPAERRPGRTGRIARVDRARQIDLDQEAVRRGIDCAPSRRRARESTRRRRCRSRTVALPARARQVPRALRRAALPVDRWSDPPASAAASPARHRAGYPRCRSATMPSNGAVSVPESR